jgi:hypothetical protein
MISLGLKLSVSTFQQPNTISGPEADYVAALTAAGATVTAPQQAAISTFMSSEIAAGRWDKMKRLYFPVWGVAAANAICMKSLTSGTFVGSVNHTTGGVASNGGYMNTNVSIPELEIANSYHYTILFKDGFSDGYDAPFGVIPDVEFLGNDGSLYVQIEDVSINLSGETFNPLFTNYGILTTGGNSNDRYVKNRNSSVVSILTNTQDFELFTYPSNRKVFFLARNNYGNPNAAYESPLGVFSMASELTTTEDTAYTLALKTLWETCTGLTLPA